MVIIDYDKKRHRQIIEVCVKALRQGKALAYPTDTSYGLAVDATNIKAIKKLYKIKGRNFDKPIHVIPPSVSYAKKIARWNPASSRLARKFWPGPLTLVLPAVGAGIARPNIGGQWPPLHNTFEILTAGTGMLGLRIPKNKIALDLAKYLKRPVTATSANISGKSDMHSASDIINQFRNRKLKPDIIIDAGKLPKRKPSTVVRIDKSFYIFRQGSISRKELKKVLGVSF